MRRSRAARAERPGHAVLLHAGAAGALAAVGLSALTGYLDIVLVPALVFFIGSTIYAVPYLVMAEELKPSQTFTKDGKQLACCAA